MLYILLVFFFSSFIFNGPLLETITSECIGPSPYIFRTCRHVGADHHPGIRFSDRAYGTLLW